MDMDKEHRRRAAVREFIVEDPGGDAEETTYVVRVSGDQAELVRGELHPWDNASGTGKDETWQSWPMNTNDLKKLLEQAQIAIQYSEAFEKAQQPPATWEEAKQKAADFNAASLANLERFVEKED